MMKRWLFAGLPAAILALVVWTPAHAESYTPSSAFHDCADYCGANDGGINYNMTVSWSYNYTTHVISNPSVSVGLATEYCDQNSYFNRCQYPTSYQLSWSGCVANGSGYSCGANWYVAGIDGTGCWYDRIQIDSSTDTAWVSQNANVHPHGYPC